MSGVDRRSEERPTSAPQRTIVLTFETPEAADAWDRLDDAQAVAALLIERTAAISRLGRGDSAGGGLSSREGRTLHPARSLKNRTKTQPT